MNTVRRLLYRDIVSSVMFVALACLSLFFFFEFVDELMAGLEGVRVRAVMVPRAHARASVLGGTPASDR